ncbi:FAD-binding oxidoreductase [Georgenia sp. SYP-B2076]|uniref:FAD-binding oxidoreductase n=1 Tax=Georgenia sp. SYP-B2076 TaxID=2495881 RepID=UPI00197ACCD2|nr:FAD-binding oxidoreductase [Georgenia sp. SYP-B2076]
MRNAVEGPVLFAGDDGLAEEVQTFNRAAAHAPAVVVGATSGADVVAAVRYANQHGLPVAVQSTGHGAFVPTRGAMLVTTKRMTDIALDVEAKTARVQPGVRWGQVIELAAPHGLAPINGSSPVVGVVGFILGGGLGPMGRKFGFAADHVRSLTLVTADGVERAVDEEHDPDLFWAVRGGKGNFGIVTSIEFDLFDVPSLYAGGIFFPATATEAVLRAYRDWVEALPNEMTTSIAFLRLPPAPELPDVLRGKFVVHLRVAYVGDPAEGERLVAPMRAVADSIIDGVGVMPYSEVASIHQDPTEPAPYWEGGLLLRELPPEAVGALVAGVGPDADMPVQLFEVRQMGGALSQAQRGPNAVGGRDARFHALVIADPAEEQAARRSLEIVAPYSTGGALLNFQGNATAPDQVAKAWAPADYARLQELKRRYDPSNVFRLGYSIAPGADASGGPVTAAAAQGSGRP